MAKRLKYGRHTLGKIEAARVLQGNLLVNEILAGGGRRKVYADYEATLRSSPDALIDYLSHLRNLWIIRGTNSRRQTFLRA